MFCPEKESPADSVSSENALVPRNRNWLIRARVPGAQQHEVLLCRTGTVANSERGTVPVLRRSVSRCTAPGTRCMHESSNDKSRY
jgi:hypothetical protein